MTADREIKVFSRERVMTGRQPEAGLTGAMPAGLRRRRVGLIRFPAGIYEPVAPSDRLAKLHFSAIWPHKIPTTAAAFYRGCVFWQM